MNNKDFSTNNIIITIPKTDDDIRGKAYVHYTAWKEAYKGIVCSDYLDNLSLEERTKKAFESFKSAPNDLIIAKDKEKVIGFCAYRNICADEDLKDTSEIGAIYILKEYYGKGVGYKLISFALNELKDTKQTSLWVIKNNVRAINFYKKVGFKFEVKEQVVEFGTPITEVRMIKENCL